MSSKSSAPWISIKLGRALNAIDIDVPSCPSISGEIHSKSRTFDAVTQSISAHLDKFDFAELSNCLSSHVPGNHTFLFHQIQDLRTKLNNAPYLIANITPVCFLSDHKQIIDLNAAMSPFADRPANIRYFRVNARIDPTPYAPAGTSLDSLEPFAADYDIPLPQNPIRPANNLPRTQLWPHITPGPQRSHPRPSLGHTIQRFAHSALPSVFAAPTPEPPPPVQTPSFGGTYNPPATSPPNSTIHTYAGNLAFLEDQTLFDSYCRPRPSFSSHDQAEWLRFCHRAQWIIFTQLVRLSYVGTLDSDDSKAMNDLAAEFHRLKMVDGKPKSNFEFENPDQLFDSYSERIPSLPEDTRSWGFCLPHIFYAALSELCRDHLDNYKPPDFSKLSTKGAQFAALATLRAEASTAFRNLQRNNANMKRLMTQQFGTSARCLSTSTSESESPDHKKTRSVSWSTDTKPDSDKATSITTAAAFKFESPAEQTLRSHKQPTDEEKVFPKNPYTDYTSKYYLGQQVCFGCGEVDPNKHNSFKHCPRRNDDSTKNTFFRELHCHSKAAREKYYNGLLEKRAKNAGANQSSNSGPNSQQSSNQSSNPGHNSQQSSNQAYTPLLMPPPTSYNFGLPPYPPYPAIPPLQQQQQPPPQQQQQPPLQQQPPPQQPPPNAPSPSPAPASTTVSHFPVRIRSFQANTNNPSRPPPMPLNIDMGFPIITWDLGSASSPSSPITLRSLFDSCGCANVGRLDYHLWIISQRPDIVAEFRFHDSHHPFDPVSLDGVVSQPSDLHAAEARHGLLTAIVRYWTPYQMPDGSPMTISFGLGEHVSTNTLTGLPLLAGLKFITDFSNFSAFSPILQRTFKLDRSPGQCGLPDDISFDVAEFRKQYDQQLAADRTKDKRGLSDTERAHSQAFFAPPSLACVDDANTGYLCRRVIANPSNEQQ